MDLFSMLNIEVSEENSVEEKKKSSKPKKEVANKSSKKSEKKASKPIKLARRYVTADEIRKMPIPLEGWSIHYARAAFQVSDIVRRLVDMDESADIEAVKAALWDLIPEESKEGILAARNQANEPATPSDEVATGNQVPDEQSEEVTSEEITVDESVEVEEDELDIDEETGEVIVRQENAKEEVKQAAQTVEKLLDGDLIVSMLEQALAFEFFEFATPGAIEWRVFPEEKRLIPYVSNGKNSMSLKKFFWRFSEFLRSEEKSLMSVVASRDGRLYDVRENTVLRVVTPAKEIWDLEKVEEGASFLLPKIPGHFLSQTIAFFKHMAKDKLEAAVYITWDLDEQKYEIHCPKQRVWMTHVKVDYPYYENKDIVCYIHSHHVMKADFSAGDDQNDQALAVYGVIGNIFSEKMGVRFRAGFNGKFIPLPFDSLFSNDSQFGLDFPREWLLNVTRGEGPY